MSSGFDELALVSGASGFIGSRLLSGLGANGARSRLLWQIRRIQQNTVIGDLKEATSREWPFLGSNYRTLGFSDTNSQATKMASL